MIFSNISVFTSVIVQNWELGQTNRRRQHDKMNTLMLCNQSITPLMDYSVCLFYQKKFYSSSVVLKEICLTFQLFNWIWISFKREVDRWYNIRGKLSRKTQT